MDGGGGDAGSREDFWSPFQMGTTGTCSCVKGEDSDGRTITGKQHQGGGIQAQGSGVARVVCERKGAPADAFAVNQEVSS